jgi:hypothetical protein
MSGCNGSRRVRRRSAGFSLIEVVVASGLLLVTITAVTFCVTSVTASGARLENEMDADRAVRLVAERLAAMPFIGRGADGGSAPDTGAEGLLEAVFPHADAARNTTAARYVPVDGEEAPAGSFVTVFTVGGVDVACAARFLVADGGPPLEPAEVEGWVLGDGGRPPGCALWLRLTAVGYGAARRHEFTRAALATTPIGPASPPAAAG